MLNPSSSPLLGVYGDREITLDHGHGSYVWDAEGRRYLDCVAGIAVNALGHCHPAVTAAIRAQSERLIHGSNLYVLPPQRDLAQRLVELSGFDKVFFSNSGTEANEGAFKFARHFFVAAGQAERCEIICFEGSFHGRTYASMAATGQEKIRKGFGPLPPGFVTLPVNDPKALREAIGPNTAAIVVEPILAEGGIIDLSSEMIESLRAAQSQGVLLIADEIQTGLWRTGTFLASETWGFKPDLVTLAKPLGGGLPLGAVLLQSRIAAALKAGDHGSTFGGNPVACAAGLAALNILSAPDFETDMQSRMLLLRQGLELWVQEKKAGGMDLGPVRGRGFLLGVRWGGDLPQVLKDLRGKGLLAHRAGSDVLRLLPPLTLSRDEIGELLGILRAL